MHRPLDLIYYNLNQGETTGNTMLYFSLYAEFMFKYANHVRVQAGRSPDMEQQAQI